MTNVLTDRWMLSVMDVLDKSGLEWELFEGFPMVRVKARDLGVRAMTIKHKVMALKFDVPVLMEIYEGGLLFTRGERMKES